MALIRSEVLFATLKAQQHVPYVHFPEGRRHALGDVIRAFQLHAGDSITLQAGNHPYYVSLLDGIAQVGPQGVEIRRGQTRLLTPHDEKIDLRTVGGAIVCIADSENIDELMSFESLIAGANTGDKLSMEALERARRSPAFRRVPLECVEEALRRMSKKHAPAGTEVIRQGEQGDLFYVMTEGRAEVWQTGLYDDEPQKVADLGPGDTFGDEALVSGGTRSATVRVSTDAELLTLDKADYQALISQQLVEEVDASVAQTMLNAGYRLLDVRYAEEHEDACIPSSTLIPLPELRARSGEIDKGQRWVVYCRSGKRSAVAALLLKQRGVQAVSLRGGINGWPYATCPGAGAG